MVDETTAAPAAEFARAVLDEARPYADRQRRTYDESGMEGLLGDLADLA